MEQRRRRFGPPEIKFRGRPVFYGWWVVTAGFLLTVLGGGFYIHGGAAFLRPLSEEFNVGYGTAALAFSAAAVGEAVLGPAIGYAVDRFGARRVMLLGLPVFSAGFWLLSLAPNFLVVFLAVALVIAPGGNLGVFAPSTAAVSHWFQRRRATALALATVGIGVGGLLVPFLQYFIDAFDWRIAARAAAIVVLAAGLPIAFFLMRNRPEDEGLAPDGEPPAEWDPRKAPPAQVADFTPREAIASPAFWGIVLWFGLRMFVVASISIHFIVIISDWKKFSGAEAAALLSIFAVATIPSRLGMGAVADRVPKNVVAGVLGFVQVGALAILFTAQEFWQLVAFVLVYAVSWGGSGLNMVAAIRADYFGLRYFATIGGMISALMIIGIVIGPFITGLIYDNTGSYDLAIWTFFAVSAASAAIILFTPRPKLKRPPRRRRGGLPPLPLETFAQLPPTIRRRVERGGLPPLPAGEGWGEGGGREGCASGLSPSGGDLREGARRQARERPQGAALYSALSYAKARPLGETQRAGRGSTSTSPAGGSTLSLPSLGETTLNLPPSGRD